VDDFIRRELDQLGNVHQLVELRRRELTHQGLSPECDIHIGRGHCRHRLLRPSLRALPP